MSVKDYFTPPRTGRWALDTVGATLVLGVAILLFPLRFFVSSVLVQTIPIVIGVASGTYLVTKRYGHDRPSITAWNAPFRALRVLRSATVVGLAGMAFVGVATGGRTLPFFGLATLVAVSVFAQIFFARDESLSPLAILLQVVAFAVILRWIPLLTTPGFVGVDAWVHVPGYAASIQGAGDLSAISGSKYFSAPLYHLLVVVAAGTFDTTLRTGLYLSLGVVLPLVVTLVYYATRQFLSVRLALFAAAAYGIADHVVRWGVHLIPTSMGLVFFLGAFYGVAKVYSADRRRGLYALVGLLGIATVLTHQISTFILLVFLGIGALAQLSFRLLSVASPGDSRPADRPVNFAGLFAVTFPLAMVVWSLAPRGDSSFLAEMLATAQERIAAAEFLDLASARTVESEAIEAMSVSVPTSVEVLDSLGFQVFLLLALLGAFALLRRKHLEHLSLSWILTAGAMVAVTLGGPLVGLYFLIPVRWYAFMYVPMIVLGAFGLAYLGTSVSKRQFMAVVAVFVLLFTGPMLVHHKATPDGPVFDDAYHEFAYTESELAAAETIGTIHPDGADIQADDPYYLLLRDWQLLSSEPIGLDTGGTATGEYAVYRDQLQLGSTQAEFGDAMVRVRLDRDQVCRPGMDVLYTNGDVWYCRANGGGGR
jgi:hypothetical protein